MVNQNLNEDAVPWYRRTRRWGQTNLTEIDPQRYDKEFWRQHWRKTRVQGVIVNAGGIVAYYPSEYSLQYRAAHLGDVDLFGAVTVTAREENLVVLARMDSNRTDRAFYDAHPDWFAVDAEGHVARAGDRYLTCVNSPYYKAYLQHILQEICERYHPEGFTDNSWTGVGGNFICHCKYCQEKFDAADGHALPTRAVWDDPVYRRWVKWSYTCRIENWDLNNQTTRRYGGKDCLWLGMIHGNPAHSHLSFCDLKAVAERSEMMMTDQQSRDALTGFEQNAHSGKLLHQILGWDKIIPESMAMYVRGERPFRHAANPAKEAHTWMVEGFAGGISPWWHHISAWHADKRQYDTAAPLMRWHEQNEAYLYNRTPIANVGVLWSQENIAFFGRDQVMERVALPWRGFTAALTRARIPAIPVHTDNIARESPHLDVLILPNLGALSDQQIQDLTHFVTGGGSLILTGQSGFYNVWGEPRADSLLQQLAGITHSGERLGSDIQPTRSWEEHTSHTYLRLQPEHYHSTGGSPHNRHRILRGFDQTDLVPFGGILEKVDFSQDANVLATYVPPFPIYPPEFSWMREPRTDIPAVLTAQQKNGGRIVYFAADVSTVYGRWRIPDHGELLANAVRWCVRDRLPLQVDGPGYLDCHLYQQEELLILHIINLSGRQHWPGYVEEDLMVGPLHITVELPDGFSPVQAEGKVSHQLLPMDVVDKHAVIELPQLMLHELIILAS
ncbi:MAG: beta-galactosidase [Anaerolineae bacterium]|nr:beta-galactosidase [Anaerolineae bacterium]